MNHHRINYIEFTAPDLEVIKTFYRKAFGWTFTDYGPDYVAFNDGVLDGGFARGEATGGNPLVILFSQDLSATRETVITCGGIITKPIFDFPGGKRFHFTDPAGNELAAWGE